MMIYLNIRVFLLKITLEQYYFQTLHTSLFVIRYLNTIPLKTWHPVSRGLSHVSF